MSSQQTDPWELSFNKPLEFTVKFAFDSAVANSTVTYGGIVTALLAQQPILQSTSTNLTDMRILACKVWGSPGGECSLSCNTLVVQTGTADEQYPRKVQHYDAGDGVRRPTCEYSWPLPDKDNYSIVQTGTTKPVLDVQFVIGPIATTPILYIKVVVRSANLVSIAPATVGSYNDLPSYKRSAEEFMDYLERKCKIQRVKELTMPVLNE